MISWEEYVRAKKAHRTPLQALTNWVRGKWISIAAREPPSVMYIERRFQKIDIVPPVAIPIPKRRSPAIRPIMVDKSILFTSDFYWDNFITTFHQFPAVRNDIRQNLFRVFLDNNLFPGQ